MVAAYVSQDGEPGTAPLLEALYRRRVETLIPILRDDFDLDWGSLRARRADAGEIRPAGADHSPTRPRRISEVSVVVCPGVAVDRAGHRLGRGGGSYDRALARCGSGVLRIQLIYDDELVERVPVDDHDVPVDVIVTPTTTIRVERH